MFVNEKAFCEPSSRLRAMGVDSRQAALVDARGNTLMHAQTGGMVSPQRYEIKRGSILFRFTARHTSLERAVTGDWWLTEESFSKMCNFAGHHGIHEAMATRILCCVPPEWSDMGLLVRARANQPILAFKGLGNPVSIPHPDGGRVNMLVYNDIAARRLYQLYIPGLVEYAGRPPEQVIPGALTLENCWEVSEQQANQGWLYL